MSHEEDSSPYQSQEEDLNPHLEARDDDSPDLTEGSNDRDMPHPTSVRESADPRPATTGARCGARETLRKVVEATREVDHAVANDDHGGRFQAVTGRDVTLDTASEDRHYGAVKSKVVQRPISDSSESDASQEERKTSLWRGISSKKHTALLLNSVKNAFRGEESPIV